MTPSHSDQWDAQLEQKRLQVAAEQVLEQAKKLGAEQVDFGAGSSQGLNVTVRNGQCEVLEYQKDRSLGVTLWVNGQKVPARAICQPNLYQPACRRPSISPSIPSRTPTAAWRSLSYWHSRRRICHSITHGIRTAIRPLSWPEPSNRPPLKYRHRKLRGR